MTAAPSLPSEFTDPRLVAIYDTVCAYAPETQPRFYSELAAELAVTRILDVGCGTGLITCDLASQGYSMTGIDPAPLMIELARQKPASEAVTWMVGEVTSVAETSAFDLAIMTGHVAQFFLTDDSWRQALAVLHRVLRPGGWLAFESRNPEAMGWTGWRGGGQWVEHPAYGRIEYWSETEPVDAGIGRGTSHYRFARTGQELVRSASLRFRGQQELAASVATAGFKIDRIYGDWDRRPAGPDTPELIVVARHSSQPGDSYVGA